MSNTHITCLITYPDLVSTLISLLSTAQSFVQRLTRSPVANEFRCRSISFFDLPMVTDCLISFNEASPVLIFMVVTNLSPVSSSTKCEDIFFFNVIFNIEVSYRRLWSMCSSCWSLNLLLFAVFGIT